MTNRKIKPSPWKEYWFARSKNFSFKKELLGLLRNKTFNQFVFHIKYIYKMASLPTHFHNLQKHLTVEQFYALQQELANQRGMNVLDIPPEKSNRASLEYRRIEQILGDYSLPIEGLTPEQLIGFAKFVCSF